MTKPLLFLLSLNVWLLSAAPAAVVINEIMYHPPDDQDQLQFIELFNSGSDPVDLSGWSLKQGVQFTFPETSAIAPSGFLVVCRDQRAFRRAYGATLPALGDFSGKLNHKGEKIELADASGKIVDAVRFADKEPWPLGPDGYGSSLEKVCPLVPGDDALNWSASRVIRGNVSGGSPGRTNDSYSPTVRPVVQNVRWEKLLKPNQPLVVSAAIKSAKPVEAAELQYQVIRSAKSVTGTNLAMGRVSGDALAGRYEVTIPAQTAGSLVRFTIKAADKDGTARVEPGPSEPRPAFSAFVADVSERGRIPLITIVNSETVRSGGQKFGAAPAREIARGRSAVLYGPPEGPMELFDFVQVRRRNGGLKVHFLRDQRLDEMSTINLIFEGHPRWVLSEHLSYELFRKAGLNIQKSGHARLTVDGRALGYYLMVEQPNKNFLERTGRNENGNLYKLQWFGNGVVGQHEKKTNPESGHGDIIALTENLRRKSGAAQWAYINEQLNVDAFVNYYAVNMCIQNWDGFFNNHFFLHDTKPGGKWDVIPWDEDKTWGEYDGCASDYSWYEMPLTMGMEGDRQQRGGWFGNSFGFGDGWWRPAGAVSGPVLANAQFRQKLLARLRELCATTFTPEHFGPVIQQLQERLRPEVELKARLTGLDTKSAVKQFDAHIQSYHRQLVNRRKFLLTQLK